VLSKGQKRRGTGDTKYRKREVGQESGNRSAIKWSMGTRGKKKGTGGKNGRQTKKVKKDKCTTGMAELRGEETKCR